MAKKKEQKKSFIEKLGLVDRYNLAFILTSIIPLVILVYVIVAFVSPVLSKEAPNTLTWLNVLVFFILFLAILGFFISRAATNETVNKVKEYNRRLHHLFDISQSLSQQIHLDVLLQDIVKSAIEMTGASAGLVLLLEEDGKTLRFEVSIGTSTITVKHIHVGNGIAGWVVKHGKLALVNDVSTDTRYLRDMNILPNFNTSAILAAPLSIGSKVYGVLELLHREEDHLLFSEEDASILKSLAGQASIFIANAEFHDQQQNYFIHVTEILISAMDGTRQFWKDHLVNTSKFANRIARMLDLSDEEMRTLHYAALLHDVGFVKINLREGSARKKIEMHPEIGYEMISPIALLKDCAPLIRYHHERFDGSGYPHGIGGEEIPLGARILAVAETMDVLTNPHSYRQKTLSVPEALKEIKAYSGTQFDPRIVQALIDSLEKTPQKR